MLPNNHQYLISLKKASIKNKKSKEQVVILCLQYWCIPTNMNILCNWILENFCWSIYFFWILDCCSELFGEEYGCYRFTEGYYSAKFSIPGKICNKRIWVLILQTRKELDNITIQESPPAWTQEAYRPARSKCYLMGGWGHPPISWMGYPPSHPDLGWGTPSSVKKDG